jgi:hypothetical protein
MLATDKRIERVMIHIYHDNSENNENDEIE